MIDYYRSDYVQISLTDNGKNKKLLVPRKEAILIKDICQSEQRTYMAWVNEDGSGSVDTDGAVMEKFPAHCESFYKLENAYAWLAANNASSIKSYNSECNYRRI